MRLLGVKGVGLLLWAAMFWPVFAAGAVSYEDTADTAYVPFSVNVNAAVTAQLRDGAELISIAQMPAVGGEEAVLKIPLSKTSVAVASFGARKRPGALGVAGSHGGKIAVNLPPQFYGNAEVSVYAVNGKRVLRRKLLSSGGAASGILRQGLAPGAYLFSVKGADGGAVKFRFAHGGGSLAISARFDRPAAENAAPAPGLAKKAADRICAVTVSAAGYADTSYEFAPAAGANNPRQNITLRPDGNGGASGTYAVKVSSPGAGAAGSGSYAPGAAVNINAGTAPEGHKFLNWTADNRTVIFANRNNAATTFTMLAMPVTVTAVFEVAAAYAVTVSSAGGGAGGTGNYVPGATVAINAGDAPAGQRFKSWTVTSGGAILASANSASTTFIMPENPVAVTAEFEANTFKVIVASAGAGASGGGDYQPGAAVDVTAGTAPEGKAFKNWASSNGGVIFADAESAATAFIMPAADVTVTAVFASTSTDLRDGKSYGYVTIGGKAWMAENLNYEATNGSWCYENKPDSCKKYGRLYDWGTAMGGTPSYSLNPSGVKGVCPTGWHLPSNAEWQALVDFVSGWRVASKKLKSASGWNEYNGSSGNGTDEYGFSALPGGLRNDSDGGGFYDTGNFGSWWTATEYDGGNAYYWGMCYVSEDMCEGNVGTDKKNGFSVRCVGD